MPTVFIRDPDTTLSTDASHFTLRSKGRKIGRIPPMMIERVILEHGVEVTRKALDRLAALGVPVNFIGPEGNVQARLVPPWRADPKPRLGQFRAFFDPSLSLDLAKRWVDAKLANSVTVIRRYLANHSSTILSAAWKEIQRLRSMAKKAPDLASLIGYEGAAGRTYFSGFGEMLRAPWAEFNGRNRRPPKDPVNAVLSYSYGLISHQLHSCTEIVGLDPYVGFLHGGDYHRPALALDLMEPFRPVLGDRLALRLVNLGTLRADHFHSPDGIQNGIRIKSEARHAVIECFERWVQECDLDINPGWPSPGRMLLSEVERFAGLAAKEQLGAFIPFYLDSAEAPT